MPDDLLNSFMTGPDEKGRFGDFGGRFVSETLMPLILELEKQYEHAKTDDSFWAEMHDLWTHYVGRPSPLYFAERMTEVEMLRWVALRSFSALRSSRRARWWFALGVRFCTSQVRLS